MLKKIKEYFEWIYFRILNKIFGNGRDYLDEIPREK